MRKLSLNFSFLMVFTCGTHAQDTLHLENYVSNLKKIDIIISGKHYSFLFDTGGGESFISPEIAKVLGKNIYGSSTGFRMSGEIIKYQRSDSISFNIGSSTIFHPTVGVWDVMSILPKEFPHLDGVLSLKSFYERIVTLDLANNKIILETPSSYQEKIKNKTLVQSRFANGPDGNELTIFLAIPNKGHLYWFLFDSGNLGKLLLSYNTATEWILKNDTNKRKELGSLNFTIGKKQFTSDAESIDIIYDGSLNYTILSKSIFVIDFRKKNVWVD